ncbi:MAG: thiamine-phosphate kinase [Parvibaculales bacterium]
MKEFDYIAKYFAPLSDMSSGLGLLDDAACLSPPPGKDLVITTDTLVEGVHYLSGTAPQDIAAKLVAVTLSDLAAKGAAPLGCLLNFAPPAPSEDWVAAFAGGLGRYLERFNCSLLGGDSVTHPNAGVFSLTAIGLVAQGQMVKRSGASPGDDIYVTGDMGAGGLGLVDAKAGRETVFSGHYLTPEPLIELGLALAPVITACADISDGFLADLNHICVASACGAQILLTDVPLADPAGDRVFQLTCGDDYQLVFTAKQSDRQVVSDILHQHDHKLSRVGSIISNPVGVVDQSAAPIAVEQKGWSHY